MSKPKSKHAEHYEKHKGTYTIYQQKTTAVLRIDRVIAIQLGRISDELGAPKKLLADSILHSAILKFRDNPDSMWEWYRNLPKPTKSRLTLGVRGDN